MKLNGKGLRAEDEEPKSDPMPEKKDEAPGREIPTKCKECGVENDEDAKHCKGCGESMATEAEEEDAGEGPPSSTPKPGGPPAKESMRAPAPMSSDASLASILGAAGSSPLQVKTAAIALRQIRDTAAGVTRETSAGKIVGGLLALPDQVEQGRRAATALSAQKREAANAERWGLAKKLNALGLAGRSRSSIFIDEVSDDGKRKAVKLMPEYARMDLEVFRGLVASLEKDAPKTKDDPFQPSRERAEEASKDAQPKRGEPSKAQIEAAKQHPAVLGAYNRSGNTLSLDRIAEQHARLFMSGGPS